MLYVMAAAPKLTGDPGTLAQFAHLGLATQHYFDARGVVRSYAMTLDDRTWTLLRDQPDATPLHFAQRFTGIIAADTNTITAIWETSGDGQHWRKDFDLTYTRNP